ncbi:site-2 protease family protein [Methanoregula sp.]|uniref:site-2 protease family protein n=1 Tax=Methanoregula sp. TaxID=2052170 RepID=UPI0025DD9AD8|nr:site-2 protease family protein [Methanoregula sp.]
MRFDLQKPFILTETPYMMMDWLLVVGVIIAVYAMLAYLIKTWNLWEEHIVFYGPILAIKTDRVGFFDWFAQYRRFFRFYGTIGVIMVIVVSALMTAMLVLSFQMTIVTTPEPTAVNELRNVLAIPGVNDFIPLTLAVLMGLIITMVVHEFGHAILCRIEGIRVRSMGILIPVIPIGAFVEPDEEDQEKTKGLAKMRMFGAGITNNIVLGVLCFGLLIFLLGYAVPLTTPVISGVYVDSPAFAAGIPANSLITEVNGVSITTRDDVAKVLDATRPGDTATVVVENNGIAETYRLTLATWPAGPTGKTSGFMGVSYYDAGQLKQIFDNMWSPVGFLVLLAIPIWVILDPSQFGAFMILMNDTAGSVMWDVPFPFFWFVIQLLFWCGWWNLVVGTFNALPLVPLDGGYIMKEGVDRLLDKKGLIRYSGHLVAAVSYAILIIILAIFLLPHLAH